MKLQVTKEPDLSHTLTIPNLTREQVTAIRCWFQIHYEVDPVEDWGFEESDGDLLTPILELGNALEAQGY